MKLIALRGQRGAGKSAIVDAADYDWLDRFKWYYDDHGYAATCVVGEHGPKQIRMHRLLMPKKAGLMTDHINRNKLDNRRSNLRYVTASDNVRNRGLRKSNVSGFNCVSPSGSKARPWKARIKFNGRYYYLGTFVTPAEAAAVVATAMQHPDKLEEPRDMRWTAAEDRVLRTVYPKHGPRKVAELTGRKASAVRVRACLKGIAYVGK